MIRLGIIGAGGAVRTLHWPVLKRIRRQIRVVALASRGIEKAQELAGLMGGPRVYSDYRDLLADAEVDAVLTAVPIGMNALVLIESIRAGKHVMAEKPLAATASEAADVLKACTAATGVVMIAENYRYRPEVAKLGEILQSGAIGEVHAFQLSVKFDLDAEKRKIWVERSWRRQPEYPGGFLLDAGVHPISFLRDVLGDITDVFAQTTDHSPKLGGSDGLLMQVKLSSGALGQYFTFYTAKVRQETLLDLSIYGSRGTIDLKGGSIQWYAGPGEGGRIRISSSDRGYGGQWRNFIEAVEAGATILSTPERAYGDLLVIDAALRSASEGKPVHISANR